jgi:hypothetical protein
VTVNGCDREKRLLKNEEMPSSTLYVDAAAMFPSQIIATWPTPASWAARITCNASDGETSDVGPFSVGPIVTTTLLAFPIALAIDSVSLKVDSTALRRLDSSFDMICGGDVIVARKNQ